MKKEMNNLESLRRLSEAVRQSGADIAPTYAEYIRLAFALTTDCGEAGRPYFLLHCRRANGHPRSSRFA